MCIVDRMNNLSTVCHVARIKSLVLEKKWFGYDYAHMLSCFSHVWLFAIPWTVACQAPMSIGFSREELLPYPPPGNLPNPEIKPMSLGFPAMTGEFFTISATWEAPWAVMSTECISMDDKKKKKFLFISRWTNQSMQLFKCDLCVCVCVCVCACIHIMWHTDPFYSSWIRYLETLFQYLAWRSKAAIKDILYYYSEIWRAAGFIERKVNPSKCVPN